MKAAYFEWTTQSRLSEGAGLISWKHQEASMMKQAQLAQIEEVVKIESHSTFDASVCFPAASGFRLCVFFPNQPRVSDWLCSDPLKMYWSVDQPAQWLLLIDAIRQTRLPRETSKSRVRFLKYFDNIQQRVNRNSQAFELWCYDSTVETQKGSVLKSCLNTSQKTAEWHKWNSKLSNTPFIFALRCSHQTWQK